MLKSRFIALFISAVALSLLSACASLPTGFEKSRTYAPMDTDDTVLGTFKHDEKEAHGDASGFFLLGDGLDAFTARAALAARAERSIDLQYYLYHDDLVGRLLTDQLIKAADRGVLVRVLLDDMSTVGKDSVIAILDSHPNIEVRLLNPFVRRGSRTLQYATRYNATTRRMHNKSFTADNQVTILGGRNIGNEYFQAEHRFTFKDMDVLCIGPVVPEVSGVFDAFWNSDLAYPISTLSRSTPTPEAFRELRAKLSEYVDSHRDNPYLEDLRTSGLVQKLVADDLAFSWGTWELIYDPPEKLQQKKSETELHSVTKLKPIGDELEEELIISAPYFVPGKAGVEALLDLEKRGVQVRIVTNALSSTNHAIVHSGYAKYRKKLLRAGIELYEMNKWEPEEEESTLSEAVLHAKVFLFDRRRLFVGSMNLDPLSIYNNTEIGVVIDQAELAGWVGEWFDANIDAQAFQVELVTDEDGGERLQWRGYEDGKEVIYTREPYTGFWKRFGVGFLRLLPIDRFL